MVRAVAGRKTPKGPSHIGRINPRHSHLKQNKAELGGGGQKEEVEKKGDRRMSRGRGRRVGNKYGKECNGGGEGGRGKMRRGVG